EGFGGKVGRVKAENAAGRHHAVDIDANPILGGIAGATKKGEGAGGVALGLRFDQRGNAVVAQELGEHQTFDVVATGAGQANDGTIAAFDRQLLETAGNIGVKYGFELGGITLN